VTVPVTVPRVDWALATGKATRGKTKRMKRLRIDIETLQSVRRSEQDSPF
jgi:hypothetical protein